MRPGNQNSGTRIPLPQALRDALACWLFACNYFPLFMYSCLPHPRTCFTYLYMPLEAVQLEIPHTTATVYVVVAFVTKSLVFISYNLLSLES